MISAGSKRVKMADTTVGMCSGWSSQTQDHDIMRWGGPLPSVPRKLLDISQKCLLVLKWRRQMMTNKLQIIINWCLHRIGRPNWYNTITNVEPMETPH